MTLTAKTYNTLNNMRLSNALLHKCVNPFVHLLIIIMKNAYLMRRDVAWVGFWVCLSVTLGSCTRYVYPYPAEKMQSYLKESENLKNSEITMDSVGKFHFKVQRTADAYEVDWDDSMYTHIRENIRAARVRLEALIEWPVQEQKEVFITFGFGEENRAKEGEQICMENIQNY